MKSIAFYGRSTKRIKTRGPFSTVMFLAVAFVVAIIVLVIVPNTIPMSVAADTAHGLGYTNVKVVERSIFFVGLTGCGGEDLVKFIVQGTNPAGNQQTFIVCAGLFKGGTPRF